MSNEPVNNEALDPQDQDAVETTEETSSEDSHESSTSVEPATTTSAPTTDEAEEDESKEASLELKKPHPVGPDGKIIDEWNTLDSFFKRFNKVLLSKLAVDKERESLQEENRSLKQLLDQYTNGITVKPEIMNTENP